MNKKEIIPEAAFNNVTIKALSHDGRGITSIKNKTTFVPGTLPEERINVKSLDQHSRYNEAELETIIDASADRVQPPCQHFGVCGGCSLQHMSSHAQIAFKQQTLLDQLKHFGQVQPKHLLDPLSVNELNYRRKARLGVKFVIKKEKLLVGFREKKSRYLADLETCPVLFSPVAKLTLLSHLIRSLDAYMHIPQIEVAAGDNNVAYVFRHMSALSENDLKKLKHFGEINHVAIYLQPNPPLPVTKLFPEDNFNFLSYSLPDENLEFFFHPLDFTQINLELNRLMVKQAMQLLQLSQQDQVLDLFCGIGNFTLPLAKRVKHVTGIEGSECMVERAYLNATHNQIQNVDFYSTNLTLPQTQKAWANKNYNKILLDPPRLGAKEILPLLKQISPERICYVSCNPATLARDAGELVHGQGYCLNSAGIMNMFPHTAHIEAMAIFTKQ